MTIPDVVGTLDLGERLRAAAEILEAVAANRGQLELVSDEDRTRFLRACRQVSSPDPRTRRRLTKAKARHERVERAKTEDKVLDSTGIRELRSKPVFTTPNVYAPKGFVAADVDGDPLERETVEPRLCYVCKQHYTALHPFYDQMCRECGDFNFAKRGELADLRGRVALLTGGRVKIGFQAGIKLLRSGARLIVTTRFPRNCATRYAAEPDFAEWGDRLEIFGLDLRHTPSVEAFCHELLTTRERLDFIVNNACQTVRRPPSFYEHMMDDERKALSTLREDERRLLGSYEGLRRYRMLPEAGVERADEDLRDAALAGLERAAELSQVALLPEDRADEALFPEGKLDRDLQQVDLRGRNSWRLQLAEVPSVELLEVQLVNAVAPFVFNARLKPLMLKTPERDKHIVNVSAVEGQFYRHLKTTRHPHTNMAKAALNMMTRTSAADYQADGIHMNSVDTGWVTDEDPAEIAARKREEHRFHPPLDIVDGAARIVDPILAGHNGGGHVWGKFLKNYRPTDW
jgi:NAD(P)-dependent dehydrogenase (short-subunit alcohol dehydrogenase family)